MNTARFVANMAAIVGALEVDAGHHLLVMNHPLPPGPSNRVLTTYRILSKPFEWMSRWRDRYGPVFLLRVLNGDVILFGRPTAVAEIFRAPADAFRPFAADTVGPLLGPTSLLLTHGDRHKRDRKLLMPPFHGERMRVYADIMRETASRYLSNASDKERTTIREIAQAISLDVIVRAVFGVSDEPRVAEFRRRIIDYVAAFSPVFSFAKVSQHRWYPAWRRFSFCFAAFEALLVEQIEYARRHPGHDILSLLLSARYEDGEPMTDADILDQLRTLLFAGHETTAVALAWTVDYLWRDAAALARAQAEARAITAVLDPVPYVDACWKEAARIRPQVTEVLRTTTRPVTIDGVEVPEGIGVSPSILLVHHDATIYPEPSRYRPERFLERRFGPAEFLPFGGGNRRCLGAAFASMEVQIVLTCVLADYELELLEPAPARPMRASLTMLPRSGVPVRIRSRAA